MRERDTNLTYIAILVKSAGADDGDDEDDSK